MILLKIVGGMQVLLLSVVCIKYTYVQYICRWLEDFEFCGVEDYIVQSPYSQLDWELAVKLKLTCEVKLSVCRVYRLLRTCKHKYLNLQIVYSSMICPVNAKQCPMARSKADTDVRKHHYIHDGSIYVFKLKGNTSAHLQQQVFWLLLQLQVLPCRRSPMPNASALSMHDLQQTSLQVTLDYLQSFMKYTLRRSSESSSYRVEQNTNCSTFLDANMPNCQMTWCITARISIPFGHGD